jgi:TMEM175 potassium channel family protein
MSKARIEAFSDGVIAVAITLLALNLPVPDPSQSGTLAHNLGVKWPSFAAFVISFTTIGIIWINHHAMLRRLVSVDHAVLIFNLLLLLTICLLPFSTALMAQYLTASHGQTLAAIIYGGSLLLMSFAFLAMHRHLLVSKLHLLDDRLTPDVRRAVLRRNAVGVLPYIFATAGAVITPYVTLATSAVVAVFYALPGTTADEQRSEAPAQDRDRA